MVMSQREENPILNPVVSTPLFGALVQSADGFIEPSGTVQDGAECVQGVMLFSVRGTRQSKLRQTNRHLEMAADARRYCRIPGDEASRLTVGRSREPLE